MADGYCQKKKRDGVDALLSAIGAVDCHLLSLRLFEPAIKRKQRTVLIPSNLPAADPKRRYPHFNIVIDSRHSRYYFRLMFSYLHKSLDLCAI